MAKKISEAYAANPRNVWDGTEQIPINDGTASASAGLASALKTYIAPGTAAALNVDTDGTLAANSDLKVATQKALKTYVDAKVAGLSWKQAVRVATTANGTLASAFANGSTIDGVTLATGDRILVKDQTTASENGIYIVPASGAPTRATDADSSAELVNATLYVSEGTTNADTQWTCSTNAPITVGSTSLAFAQLAAGSSGGGVPWVNVKTYGAVGDGTTDDTSAVSSAIAAIPSTGGVLYFPAGKYKTSGGFTLSNRTLILGDGAAGPDSAAASYSGVSGGISTVLCTSATAHLFTFAVDGCRLERINLQCTATTPSAGSGLRVTKGWGMSLRNFSVCYFYNNVQIEDGAEYIVDGFYNYGPVNYAFYIRDIAAPDGGDTSFTNGHIVPDKRNAAAAFYIASGGGVKISNVKINGRPSYFYTNGIYLDVPSTVQTILLQVSNCSIENVTGSHFKARCASGGSWHHLMLSNVQFGNYTSSVDFPAIDIAPTSSGALDNVTIVGCIFSQLTITSPAISLTRVAHARIAHNVCEGFASLLSQSSCSDILADYVSKAQTEAMSGFIGTPSNKTYTLVVKMPHAGTITETSTISASGTCTATFKINTTALGGTANAVSTTQQDRSQASANTFAAGDSISMTISSNSSCADLSFTIKYTRTLAS